MNAKIIHFIKNIKKKEQYPILEDETLDRAKETSGVYIVWKRGLRNPVYVGETKSIKARMKDIRRTWNHTLRKKIASREFGYELEKGRGKFPDNVEKKIDKFMKNKLKVSFFPITFGRKEIEEALIYKFPDMYNSPIKRGKSSQKALKIDV